MDAIDVPKAVDFIVSCMNFDGGFGCVPGSESHSGQVRHLLYQGRKQQCQYICYFEIFQCIFLKIIVQKPLRTTGKEIVKEFD